MFSTFKTLYGVYIICIDTTRCDRKFLNSLRETKNMTALQHIHLYLYVFLSPRIIVSVREGNSLRIPLSVRRQMKYRSSTSYNPKEALSLFHPPFFLFFFLSLSIYIYKNNCFRLFSKNFSLDQSLSGVSMSFAA